MQEVPGIEVFGGIVLNRAVGGINTEAVRRMIEMEGRRGRIVWLPTIDAENQIGFARESRPFIAVVRQGKPVPNLRRSWNSSLNMSSCSRPDIIGRRIACRHFCCEARWCEANPRDACLGRVDWRDARQTSGDGGAGCDGGV